MPDPSPRSSRLHEQVDALRAEGLSVREACARLGCSTSSYYRKKEAAAARGDAPAVPAVAPQARVEPSADGWGLCDPGAAAELLHALRVPMSLTSAALVAGLNPNTVKGWRRKGHEAARLMLEAEAAGRDPSAVRHADYVRVADALDGARARGKYEVLKAAHEEALAGVPRALQMVLDAYAEVEASEQESGQNLAEMWTLKFREALPGDEESG